MRRAADRSTSQRCTVRTLTLIGLVGVAAPEQVTRTAAPPTIPLCPGLTVVGAVSEPRGDYEPIVTVQSITRTAVNLRYSTDGDAQRDHSESRRTALRAARGPRVGDVRQSLVQHVGIPDCPWQHRDWRLGRRAACVEDHGSRTGRARRPRQQRAARRPGGATEHLRLPHCLPTAADRSRHGAGDRERRHRRTSCDSRQGRADGRRGRDGHPRRREQPLASEDQPYVAGIRRRVGADAGGQDLASLPRD